MIIIGLMSGTSVDGIDAAVVEINGAPPALNLNLRAFVSLPYTKSQYARIYPLFDPKRGTVDQICEMNFVMGEWFAAAATAAMKEAGLSAVDVDLIASHGQTIYHRVEADLTTKSTLQIAESAVIAEQTGITTIANFRTADVAAGGQGAPMVSYADWLLFRHPHMARVAQNIGGIANFTFVPSGDMTAPPFALDTGPGNMLIDAAVRRFTQNRQTYDDCGGLAAQGTVNEKYLSALMAHPYFALPLPKTTGREQFGEAYAAQILDTGEAMGLPVHDIIATMTTFTAASIADAYRRYLPALPAQVIVSGGGAHNATLLDMLRRALPGVEFMTPEAFGFSADAKEAVVFALLAYETIHGRAGNLPACTGAVKAKILGNIAPGENYHRLSKLIWSAIDA